MKRPRMEERVDFYEEKDSEDWCFICKDGGDLMTCDYEGCLKVYHPGCVGKKMSFVHTVKRWTCRKHSCSSCLGNTRFSCFCCPNSVCRHCVSRADFTLVGGKNNGGGFCKDCLKLVLLAEENSAYGLDGQKIDFEDRDTFECLFKEYWEIIKEKEGLTSDDVYSAAKAQLNKEKGDSSTKEDDEAEFGTAARKRRRAQEEYIGWGSKPLIEFLKSIGKDPSKQLSQHELDCLIHDYIIDRNLFHPKTKKKVLCDDKLYSIFRRKSVDRIQIYGLLETHITAENVDESKLVDKKKDIMVASNNNGAVLMSSANLSVQQQSCIASIVADNLKLVYLRRSLVEELLKQQPENFVSKVVGSYVRVKNDPRGSDYLQKNSSHQLLQVQGIRIFSFSNEHKTISEEVLLQVSNFTREFPISMLSDFDFTEEECEDLRQNYMTNDLRPRPRKPTVSELEEKARALHEDITKHWIERELVRLQNRIDRANVKGRRRELGEYLDRIELLRQPSVQERLLKQVPKVIAEDFEAESGDVDSLHV